MFLSEGVVFSPTLPGDNELMLAIESGNVSLVEKLLDRGINVNMMNRRRMSALHFAVKANNLEMVQVSSALLVSKSLIFLHFDGQYLA